jgi:acyl dehydratase
MTDPTTPLPDYSYPDRRGFEDLAIGDRFSIPSRTMTEALFAAFQTASADNHPIHYDREYCRRRGHPDLLAHGFQVLIQTAAGAGTFAHAIGDALIAFLDQSSKFLAPVYAGDTLYAELVVVALERQRTTGVVTLRSTVRNQRGVLCLEGTQRYLLRLAAAPAKGGP